MKKLINDPRHVVREMLEGLTDLSPGLALLADETSSSAAICPNHKRAPSPSFPAAERGMNQRMRASLDRAF